MQYSVLAMEKRVHSRRTAGLPCRHYLAHFKRPLFSFCIILSLIGFAQRNFRSPLSSDAELDFLELLNSTVIYPVNGLNRHSVNTSISYHFTRKDQLRAVDDARAMNSKQKVVLPWADSRRSTDSYLIVEYTKVFLKPRFCSHTNAQIFGETCPYTNW